MKLKHILLILSVILAFVSCSDEDTVVPGTGGKLSEGYMKIQMNLPEFKTPTTAGKATRAMSPLAEKSIDPDKFSVLVFKYNDNGGNVTETFDYQAPLSGGLVIDADNPSKAELTVKLVKSESTNDKFRIVIVANHNIAGVNMVKDQTSKAEIYRDLIYNASGKWNADDTNPTLFPMWGETQPIVVTENMSTQQINLIRALARIDVGLGFIAENGKLTETAEGINDFSLKEIKVYRTYNKGTVASLETDYKSNPTIPASAEKREDNNPLAYALAYAAGGNAYVREIYVPEANIPSSPNNDNMHCLVIGGYYRGSTTMTFYRLDFATLNTANEPDYFHIMRNHRYIFNITEVMGPGFSTAEEALKSHPTIEKINYDLIVWDETIHEMEVQGKYYFGLDQRDLLFEAPSSTEAPNNIFNIRYQTNYPLSTTDPLKLLWKSEVENPTKDSPFAAVWDPSTKGIKLTAKEANETNKILSDSLIVKAGPFTMKVLVQQKYINFKYTVTCETVVVTGTYKKGGTLNTNHYIDLSITADHKSIEGYNYILETDTVNGISFRAEGKFNFAGIGTGQPLVQNIRLMGTGVLDTPSGNTEPFTLQIRSNSSSGSYCEATISPVIPTRKVLTFATGYYGVEPGNKANKILTSHSNFGPNDNSIVNVEGFDIVYPGAMLNAEAEALLTKSKGELADFVVIGHAGNVTEQNKNLFINYLKKGGVIVAFLENPGVLYAGPLLRGVFPGCTVSWSSPSYAGGTVYPLPGNDAYKNSYVDPGNKPWDVYFAELQNDPILVGPFGDVRDKQWGEDASSTTWVSGIPTDHLTIYSTSGNLSNNNVNSYPDKITGFRYQSENINLVWFGDGGFTSGLGSPGGTTAYPFDIDTNNNYPKPVNNYGSNARRYPVYNSLIFANAMAWAIQRSSELQAKRDAATAN